jgi:hypothetical protein
MNTTVQVISIALAIAVLAFLGYWILLRPRDQEGRDAHGKMGDRASLHSRQDARQKGKTSEKTQPAALDEQLASSENPPGSAPEKDRAASSPELKDSIRQEDTVFTITPPGKNGRPKH